MPKARDYGVYAKKTPKYYDLVLNMPEKLGCTQQYHLNLKLPANDLYQVLFYVQFVMRYSLFYIDEIVEYSMTAFDSNVITYTKGHTYNKKQVKNRITQYKQRMRAKILDLDTNL